MTLPEVPRSERVDIDKSVLPIYKELTEGQNAEQTPFKTYKDVFLMAMCLGYEKGSRQKLPDGKKSTIRTEVFRNDIALLKAVAIADTGDVQVLSQLSEVLTIAEEYAHAGIVELRAYLLEPGGRPLWRLVDLLASRP